MAPVGEDLLAPAHIWEKKLQEEEKARHAKKQRPDLDEPDSNKESEDNETKDAEMSSEQSSLAGNGKRPRDKAEDGRDKKNVGGEESALMDEGGVADDMVGVSLRPAAEPTPILLVTKLPTGFMAKVLTDVFRKYGDLRAVQTRSDSEAIVKYGSVDAARWMKKENDGRSVLDNHIGVAFVHMEHRKRNHGTIADDATSANSTILTKDAVLPPAVQASKVDSSTSDSEKEQKAAILVARHLCPPTRLQQFDEEVAKGSPLDTLFLLATSERPGSVLTP